MTLHNLHFYLNLMRRIRAHIEASTFAEFRKKFVGEYVPWKPEEVAE